MGDFNELTSMNEKLGGAIMPERQMVNFRQIIDDCRFLDFLFTGL